MRNTPLLKYSPGVVPALAAFVVTFAAVRFVRQPIGESAFGPGEDQSHSAHAVSGVPSAASVEAPSGTARTSQGAIAWAVALITWPVVTVPLYWVFGRSRFHGYVTARRTRNLKLLGIVDEDEIRERTRPFRLELGEQSGNA